MKKNTFLILIGIMCLSGCTYDNEEDLGIKVPGGLIEVVSFSSNIKPILTNKCAITGCHIAGNNSGIPDFSVESNVFELTDKIKKNILNGTMPKTGSLTFNQKDLIISWINQGAKDN